MLNGKLFFCAASTATPLLALLLAAVLLPAASGGCSGTPTSCSTESSSSSCGRIDGCSWGGTYPWERCSGSARGCGGYASRSGCRDQGCTWKADDGGGGGGGDAEEKYKEGRCSGTPDEFCGGYLAHMSVESQRKGCVNASPCSWDVLGDECEGVADYCRNWNDKESLCINNGCDWAYDNVKGECGGSPAPCEGVKGFAQCALVRGCDWDTGTLECGGSPTSCSKLDHSRDKCKKTGCRWKEISGSDGPSVPSVSDPNPGASSSTAGSSAAGASKAANTSNKGGGIAAALIASLITVGLLAWAAVAYRRAGEKRVVEPNAGSACCERGKGSEPNAGSACSERGEGGEPLQREEGGADAKSTSERHPFDEV